MLFFLISYALLFSCVIISYQKFITVTCHYFSHVIIFHAMIFSWIITCIIICYDTLFLICCNFLRVIISCTSLFSHIIISRMSLFMMCHYFWCVIVIISHASLFPVRHYLSHVIISNTSLFLVKFASGSLFLT